ncbi:hypothetical protein [Salinicola socius]|uniref:Uncharacterized protein n=1 Tax=Salinicola socius TaxID=404433 RepID=A0A1Q8SPK0_9GAMM|nr:hypothetical protein [Salinicola socius]OLO03326.1 hypothetical protein BTW07_14680 [Salinicola socius]
MKNILQKIRRVRKENMKKPFPKTDLAAIFANQSLIGLFLFAALIQYLAYNFQPTDAEFMSAVKGFPSWEVFGLIAGVASLLGFRGSRVKPIRLIALFSITMFVAAVSLHFVPADMVISGASQARQTAVFGPLTLMIIGILGAVMNLVWLAFYHSDSQKQLRLI